MLLAFEAGGGLFPRHHPSSLLRAVTLVWGRAGRQFSIDPTADAQLPGAGDGGAERFHDSNRRALRVAVIGPPNAGKSALTNQLVRAKVCAVSKCIDTTRSNMVTSLTESDCQLVVVDSPGVIGVTHAKKVVGTGTDDKLLVDPEQAIGKAEHVLVVHDATSTGKYIHHRVLHLLHRYAHVPSTLVINKIDLAGKRTDLLPLAEILTEGVVDGVPIQSKRTLNYGLLGNVRPAARDVSPSNEFHIHQLGAAQHPSEMDEEWQKLYNSLIQKPVHKCGWNETRRLFLNRRGWPNFRSIFFISSVTGEGTEGLRDYLTQLSHPSERWRYGEQEITTKDPRRICEEHVRSQLLDRIPSDAAYKLWPLVTDWLMDDEQTGPLMVCIAVDCERAKYARMVLKVAAAIEFSVKDELRTLFKVPVEFRLDVRHRGKSVELDSKEIRKKEEEQKKTVVSS